MGHVIAIFNHGDRFYKAIRTTIVLIMFGVYTNTQSGRLVINPGRASERVISSGSLKDASQTNVDLGFKPPGLKWKGKNAMTGNQLQLMSQRKKL